MSELVDVHILFQVPKGLEFIAITDLQSCLSGNVLIIDPIYRYEPLKKTGRIHLFCKTPSLSQLKQHISTTSLLCVFSVLLVVSQSSVPDSLLSEDDVGSFFDFVAQQTKLAPWYDAIQKDEFTATTTLTCDNDSNIGGTGPTTSFRATFQKDTASIHYKKATSKEIAGYIGYAFSGFFKHWKVKMEGYTHEIVGLLFRASKDICGDSSNSSSNSIDDNKKEEETTCLLLLGIMIPIRQDQPHRNRIYFGKSSLNQAIAYCLALLAEPKAGEVILDMCCGTGTIPIEGASRFENVFWIGNEVHAKTLTEKAKGNVDNSGVKNIDLMLGDGRSLCYRQNSIDTIVSDWPWGVRENTYRQIQKLYPRFMKQMWDVIKPGGKAYIVTQGNKLMRRILAHDWCQNMWSTEKIIPINIGGMDVSVYILSKKNRKSD